MTDPFARQRFMKLKKIAEDGDGSDTNGAAAEPKQKAVRKRKAAATGKTVDEDDEDGMATEKPTPKKRGRKPKEPTKVKDEIKDEDEAEVMNGGAEDEYVDRTCFTFDLSRLPHTDCHKGSDELKSAFPYPDARVLDETSDDVDGGSQELARSHAVRTEG